jgi:hypothetical protein
MIMSNMTRNLIRAGAIAVGMMAMTPLTASAGEWRLNPARCPDLREDFHDMQRDHGWRDREEDRHDRRVVQCPARAWTYHRDRGERGYPRAYPREVILMYDGRVYERTRRGQLVNLGINLRLG